MKSNGKAHERANGKKTNGNGKSQIKMCVVGPGVVGQATGKVFALQGFSTSFLGGSSPKVKRLQEEGFKVYAKTDLFDGDYDFDITFLTVPTPTINGKIDLSIIKSAAMDLGKRLKETKKEYHLIVVKSTVPPGSTEKLIIPLIEKYSKRNAGKDLGFCMNPEYLREETAFDDALKPWAIVIGELDKKSGDLLELAYGKFTCPVFRCSLAEAEMQKYVHNLFNAVKISFFNEMREIGKRMGIDPEKVFAYTALSAEGMWNPKYGIKNKGPFTGSCLPKDTKAFLDWAIKNKYDVTLLKSAIEVNNKILKSMNMNQGPQIIGSSL